MKRLILITCMFLLSTMSFAQKEAQATFAMGCFWCAESDFEKVPGVSKVLAGYTGGWTANPTYKAVGDGKTGHYEAVQVFYDPEKVSYQQLLNVFWHNIDPKDAEGQFCDRGDEYRAAIFYQNKEEKKLAEASRNELLKSKKFEQIVTMISPATKFYPAEEEHQDYAKKNPWRYKFYRFTCRRDARLEEIWGKETESGKKP